MKIKYIFLYISVLLLSGRIISREMPKLVVGIVVDQMRFDYLYKFRPYYCKGGFNRLVDGGSNFTYAHYNYSPTNTGPGHATIFTGATPFYSGIIGNDWYDRKSGKMIYCARDTTFRSVGSNDEEGRMSPLRLLSTTITDQLKLATNRAAKVIAVSLKDRSAIFPGGHFPDGAYWYDNKTGDMITSSFYMTSLPNWVDRFNAQKLADKYLAGRWSLSRPPADYEPSGPDESKYEKDLFKEGKTSFPHAFDKITGNSKYEALENTPFGNEIVEEFSKGVLTNEKLGKGKETDFLTISFSSTDFVGHEYGTFSYELKDLYIKLDSLLADLLSTLDRQVGKGNYLLFLSADHGALDTPGYLKDHNLPSGNLEKKAIDSIKTYAAVKFGTDNLISNFSNGQIFLNRKLILLKNIDIHEVERSITDYIRNRFPEVTSIFKRDDLENQSATREPFNPLLNGFNPALSGDILLRLQPDFLPTLMEKGTTHGSAYQYDTHVPLIFYGWHIPKQTVNAPVYTVDIAATVADLLKIQEPGACIGIPLIR
jgi:predicted AlkP superfamily pyrophosphatase or phosphodiesterase